MYVYATAIHVVGFIFEADCDMAYTSNHVDDEVTGAVTTAVRRGQVPDLDLDLDLSTPVCRVLCLHCR